MHKHQSTTQALLNYWIRPTNPSAKSSSQWVWRLSLLRMEKVGGKTRDLCSWRLIPPPHEYRSTGPFRNQPYVHVYNTLAGHTKGMLSRHHHLMEGLADTMPHKTHLQSSILLLSDKQTNRDNSEHNDSNCEGGLISSKRRWCIGEYREEGGRRGRR